MFIVYKDKKGTLNSVLKCDKCNNKFKFVDDVNGFAEKYNINLNRKDTETEINIIAVCDKCNYISKYHAKLNLNM